MFFVVAGSKKKAGKEISPLDEKFFDIIADKVLEGRINIKGLKKEREKLKREANKRYLQVPVRTL